MEKARLRNFTLEGNAVSVTAYITPDGETAYTVELAPKYDREGLTYDEFKELSQALHEDACGWDGVMGSRHISDFEETWGGGNKADGVRLHTPPEAGV